MTADRPPPTPGSAPRARHGEAIYDTLLMRADSLADVAALADAAGIAGTQALVEAVPALPLHLGRLRGDAEALALPWPGNAAVIAAVIACCAAVAPSLRQRRLSSAEYVRLRLDLYADDELDPAQAPARSALATQVRAAGDRVRPPARVTIGPRLRSAADPLAGCKRAAVASERMLLRAAQGRDLDDVLLLDVEGRLSEATTSALLISRGGRLYTPCEAAAPLRSTTMALLEALLDPAAGPSPLGAVQRVELLPTDLMLADFALLVNAVAGGRAIASVDGATLPPPPASLLATLRDLVAGGVGARLAVERLRRGSGPAWAQRAVCLGDAHGASATTGGVDGASPGAQIA